MKKTTFLGSILAVMLFSVPAMAGDFHALSGLQGAAPAPLQDQELAATEGGAFCFSIGGSFASVNSPPEASGGVALCADLPSISGLFASFSVVNQLPVSAAQFLQVVGF